VPRLLDEGCDLLGVEVDVWKVQIEVQRRQRRGRGEREGDFRRKLEEGEEERDCTVAIQPIRGCSQKLVC